MNIANQSFGGIRSPSHAGRGFALVVTLSLMILLTVIAVGLLTLSSISLRSSSFQNAQATARANARMALMLAIGELQKMTGSDQRVTITSSLQTGSDPPNPNWTGATDVGEPMKYKGPRRFMVRTSEAEFLLKPPLPTPLAWVDLPLNADRVLLVCLKSADAPLKMIAYDIGKARIGAGEYRFFNFSRSVISVKFGDRKFAVKAGEETLVSDASWKREVMEIDLEMAIIKDGKAKPVNSSQWGNRSGRRNYIFMFDGPQDYKPIRICRYFDIPPAGARNSTP